MYARSSIRFLWTGVKAIFIALFKPVFFDHSLATSRRPHSVFSLLLLMIFSHAPAAQGEECWVTSMAAGPFAGAGWSHISFGTVDLEYTRSALVGLNSVTQKYFQNAASYLSSVGCSLQSCGADPDIIVYNNGVSPPLPIEYIRYNVFCRYTCPVPNGPPEEYQATISSIRSITQSTDGYQCGYSYVIKLSNDTSPPTSGNLAELNPGQTTTTLRAKVYNSSNQLVSGVDVKLEVTVDAGSGGHVGHNNDRDKGLLSGNGQTGISIVGNTGSDGLRFTFTAPPPAGDHKIIASCTNPGRTCTQEGPDKLWVGIKDLVSLYDTNGSVLYRLVGSSDTHPSNHYLAWNRLGSAVWLAQLYKETFPGDPVLHYNDASLERGGLFDIRNNWSFLPVGHETHRKGDIIDVRANPAVNPGSAIPERNFADFVNMACWTGGVARIHSPGSDNQHYHVHFRGCTPQINFTSVDATSSTTGGDTPPPPGPVPDPCGLNPDPQTSPQCF